MSHHPLCPCDYCQKNREEYAASRPPLSAALDPRDGPDADQTYSIVRFYTPSQNRANEIIKTGLTLDEAQEHCNDPDTRKDGVYFDGYQRE